MTILSTTAVLFALIMGHVIGEDSISVRGSAVVAEPLALASTGIREEVGIVYQIVTEGGSSDAIFRMAGGNLDVALSTRYMTAAEKAEYPDKAFKEILIGKQAIVVVVSDKIWGSGIRALTKEQLRSIYELQATNWKQFGGEDRDITYYNREAGRGAWDLFTNFLYTDARKAPPSKAEVLPSSGEVCTAIEFNAGGVSIVDLPDMKGEGLHALGLKQADGTVIEPTLANIASGRYELSRPMLLITGQQTTGKFRRFLDFMLGEKGQAFVKKAGGVTVAELKAAK